MGCCQCASLEPPVFGSVLARGRSCEVLACLLSTGFYGETSGLISVGSGHYEAKGRRTKLHPNSMRHVQCALLSCILTAPHFSLPGESFAEFRSTGTDDGFTDFKTADSVSPLEPPTKDSFPSAFASGAAQQTQTQVKTPLNLADLDMFSSVDCSGEKPVPFSAAFSTSKSVSSRPQPAGSAAAPASLASTKASSLADDFGEFNLFGEYSNPASVGEQDDFADFMAFGNSSIPSEPKADDKYEALREEGSPGALSTSTVEGAHNPPVSSSKYDVFKQLSLEGAGLAIEEFKENTPSTKSDGDFADFHSSKFSSTSSDKSLGEKAVAFRHAKEDSASVKSLDLPSIGGSSVGKEDSEDALSVQFDMKLADVGGDLKHVMSDSSLDLPTVSGQHPPAAGEELVRLLW